MALTTGQPIDVCLDLDMQELLCVTLIHNEIQAAEEAQAEIQARRKRDMLAR